MKDAILLVDDNQAFREEFRECFDMYEVVQAADGAEALRILSQAHAICLVLLDVMMPGMRGTEVLRRIKEADPNLGVVILTAYSSKDVAVEALKAHADDYLEKPIDLAKTRALIEKYVARARDADGMPPGGIPETVERIQRFVRRNVRRRVTLDDVAAAVYLSPKYVSRLFKEATGKSFTEFRSEALVERARELLAETGSSIAGIAAELGYENPESFIRVFKKVSRMTPREFRTQAARRDETRTETKRPSRASRVRPRPARVAAKSPGAGPKPARRRLRRRR
ncbi:MAG TPA: hypothetical protein DCM87_10850 [Planctomycetes bacterium]|nr:hypothetical protein [Planctomycetota bacterium]